MKQSVSPCRVDTVASYGQLLGQPSFGEHDPLFPEEAETHLRDASGPADASSQQHLEAGHNQNRGPEATSGSGAQLHITVTDPVKKVGCTHQPCPERDPLISAPHFQHPWCQQRTACSILSFRSVFTR